MKKRRMIPALFLILALCLPLCAGAEVILGFTQPETGEYEVVKVDPRGSFIQIYDVVHFQRDEDLAKEDSMLSSVITLHLDTTTNGNVSEALDAAVQNGTLTGYTVLDPDALQLNPDGSAPEDPVIVDTDLYFTDGVQFQLRGEYVYDSEKKEWVMEGCSCKRIIDLHFLKDDYATRGLAWETDLDTVVQAEGITPDSKGTIVVPDVTLYEMPATMIYEFNPDGKVKARTFTLEKEEDYFPVFSSVTKRYLHPDNIAPNYTTTWLSEDMRITLVYGDTPQLIYEPLDLAIEEQ